MRAFCCITSAIVLCLVSSLSGAAMADPADKPTAHHKRVVKSGPEAERKQRKT